MLDTVERVVEGLRLRHEDLVGPCGALKITSRVAWELRDSGAGLLQKDSGNNCEGYAVDIVAFPDGRIVDVLIDAGGFNTPTWQEKPEKVDPGRWHAPWAPEDVQVEATPVVVVEPEWELKEQLDHIETLLRDLLARPTPIATPVVFPAYTGRLGFNVRLTPEK